MTLLPVVEWRDQDHPFQLSTRNAVIHHPGQSCSRDRHSDYCGSHLGFYEWLCMVNRRIERATTLSLMDLPDRCWRDECEDHMQPGDSADVALDETAAEFGIDLP